MVMAETQFSPESRWLSAPTRSTFEPARTPPPAFPFLHDQLVKEQNSRGARPPPKRHLRDNEASPDGTGKEPRRLDGGLAPNRAARLHRPATRAYLMEPPAPVNTGIQRPRKS